MGETETPRDVKMLYLKGTHESLVDAHHGTRVVKLPTVIGGGKQSYQLPFCKELVAIFDHLESKEDGQCSGRDKKRTAGAIWIVQRAS